MKSFFDPTDCEQTRLSILSLNVAESKKTYNVTLLAPGLHRNDISVLVKGNRVTITNKKERSNNPLRDPEYSFSSFTRSFTTLHLIDKNRIKLIYKNDLITVTLAKKQETCRDLPLTKSTSHPVASAR